MGIRWRRRRARFRGTRRLNRGRPISFSTADLAFQRSIAPGTQETFDIGQVLTSCPRTNHLLDVDYDWNRVPVPGSLREFEKRWSNRREPLDVSGVWRFRELLPFAPDNQIVTIGEGQTILQRSDVVGRFVGLNSGGLYLQYEGLNPSGSFKDNGMTAAATHARMVGAKLAACASTGNTSASLAIYAAVSGLFRVIVFVGSGRIAYGKLSQALDYGATTLQIMGDFDDALRQVRDVCREAGIYLCNSVNPFRLEGQKSIIYRILEGLDWETPDWIVVPGGNLGNSSAFGKALLELKKLNLIKSLPRLAVINAQGANTLYELYEHRGLRWNDGRPDQALVELFYQDMDARQRRAQTLASAIEINRPVNLSKCLRALDACQGVVREASDGDILNAKAMVGAGGFGCEPASAASVAGARRLREEGVIAPSDRVVCILTGHLLKDPEATIGYHSVELPARLKDRGITQRDHQNVPIAVENDFESILRVVERLKSH